MRSSRRLPTRPRRSRAVRVGLVSLGCAKNLVDTEIMLGSLVEAGMEITNDARLADAVIINTCSFIDAAQEESVDAILEQAAVREALHRGQALVVAGCLPQRHREELAVLLPEVDAFMGLDQVRQAPEVVQRALARRAGRARPSRGVQPAPAEQHPSSAPAESPDPVYQVSATSRFIPDVNTPRFRLTPPHYAFLKIAEGCNHPCSFCVIPRIRGRHRSRPLADVVEEARRLLDQGVREINLISQDTTFYGRDLMRKPAAAGGEPADLGCLLRQLDRLPGDFWVRLLYTHPAHWTDELIEVVADCSHVVPYIDVPLQHIDDVMLQRMRRETTRAQIERLIERLRDRVPGVTLRTTFIVGFPGETDRRFQSLLDFIRQARFERLGVFAYSQEEGTVAGRMEDQVPEAERQRRRQQAMAVQREVSRQVLRRWKGRRLKVLVEDPLSLEQLGEILDGAGAGEEWLPQQPWRSARSLAEAPDIDGRVLVPARLPAGEFTEVRIEATYDYDCLGQPVGGTGEHAPSGGTRGQIELETGEPAAP